MPHCNRLHNGLLKILADFGQKSFEIFNFGLAPLGQRLIRKTILYRMKFAPNPAGKILRTSLVYLAYISGPAPGGRAITTESLLVKKYFNDD